MSEVNLKINDENGFFYIELDGKVAGKMTFAYADENKIIIDHTEVKPGNEGKGFGKQMVVRAVEYAREKGFKIIPHCSFVKNIFDKNREFSDVL